MFDHLDIAGLEKIDGHVTTAAGFVASGATTGVKASGKPDLALIVATQTATVAAITTNNQTKAPACVITDKHAATGTGRAVVINSGNANLCTADAVKDADAIVSETAKALQVAAEDVLIMSTGVIGVPLPVDKVLAGIPTVAAALTPDGGHQAAKAILTTDTVAKTTAYRVSDANGSCLIGGIAKGVGMIEPNMATMLAIITTDAAVDATTLKQALVDAANDTFHVISVDGDTSTSDTVAVMASGQCESTPHIDTFRRGLTRVCADLAEQVVRDGEGATRVARVRVAGATDHADAKKMAHAVATSLLVRAAIHGADPNWGRVMMGLGNAGVVFDPSDVTVTFAGHVIAEHGMAVTFDHDAVAEAMNRPEVTIDIHVGTGPGEAMMLTCDLTPEYVRFNSEYTT